MMNEVIFETKNFSVEVPERPFVDREDGGHLRIMSKIKVRDRTKLTIPEVMEYTLLSMLVGESLEKGLLKRGIEIGIVNYQEMGHWRVFKPEGVNMHMHIFGRAKDAKFQKYGEAVKLPFRETGFYDEFNALDKEDLTEIKKVMSELLATEKYKALASRKVVVLNVMEEDLTIINNALNEILNGSDAIENDGEFHARIGSSREEAEKLLKKISNLNRSVDV